MGKQAVNAGNTHIVEAFHLIAQHFGCKGCFFCHRNITGAAGGYQDSTGSSAVFPAVYDSDTGKFIIGKGKTQGQIRSRFLGKPGNQNIFRAVG